MLSKAKEHQEAIALRKQGKSYSEILSVIPVSKSSLSLWLRAVNLTKQQLAALLSRKKAGQIKGGLAKRKSRESQERVIINIAAREIKKVSRRELWLLGIIAYWCEGSKQKEENISQGVIFVNSDPFLLRLFIKWVKEFCFVKDKDIIYTLYIHETGNIAVALDYWSKTLGIKVEDLGKISIKKHNVLTKRKNRGKNYHGLIRISIRKSTNLNRKIRGWVMGINNLI